MQNKAENKYKIVWLIMISEALIQILPTMIIRIVQSQVRRITILTLRQRKLIIIIKV